MKRIILVAVFAVAAVCLAGESARKVYCAQCGRYWTSRAAMGNSNCEKHPKGRLPGRHYPAK